MAGHSKWANIQHRKGRQDEKRGKIWTRIIREITVAARQGGSDVSANPRLRLAIDKAKAANMPADRIKYNVDKASGNLEGISYEEIRYEGYGIAAGQHAPLGPCLFASADAHRLGGEPLAGAWHNVGTPAQLADVDARLRATDWAAAVPGAGPAPG